MSITRENDDGPPLIPFCNLNPRYITTFVALVNRTPTYNIFPGSKHEPPNVNNPTVTRRLRSRFFIVSLSMGRGLTSLVRFTFDVQLLFIPFVVVS